MKSFKQYINESSEFEEVKKKIVNKQNAKEWQATSDKFAFVIDLLNDNGFAKSAHSRNAETIVNKIEDELEKLV